MGSEMCIRDSLNTLNTPVRARYQLNTGTRYFGKIGNNPIPVPRVPVYLDQNTGGTGICSVRYRGYRLFSGTIRTHRDVITWQLGLCWHPHRSSPHLSGPLCLGIRTLRLSTDLSSTAGIHRVAIIFRHYTVAAVARREVAEVCMTSFRVGV